MNETYSLIRLTINEISNLIRLKHPTALQEALEDVKYCPDEFGEIAENLMLKLSVDDTFNGYSEKEMVTAIHELLND